MSTNTEPDQVEEQLYQLTRLQERQTEALETLAEQAEIQNAVLLEQTHALYRRLCFEMGNDPDNYGRSRQTGFIEDNLIDLAQQVDLDEVRRWSDG